MTIAGSWDLRLRTPIGSLDVVYTFVDNEGTITATATGKGETVVLRDIAVSEAGQGERVTWRQSVTRPMRLNLEFDVVVDGDTLSGHSRAGRLPRTQVAGRRRR